MSCQQAEHQRQRSLEQRDGLKGEFPAYAGFAIHAKPKGYVAASNLQHLTQCLGIIDGSPLFSIQTNIQHELLGKLGLLAVAESAPVGPLFLEVDKLSVR